jgi:uncharacterized membrane protein
MKQTQTRFLAQAALIAALYCVLTYVSALMGLASGAIQLRLSEMLTILPYFTPAAIPGLFVGCALANLLTGCAVWDIVFGSLATLLGALGTWALRHKCRYLACIPPIISNTVIVPFVLRLVYGVPGSLWYLALTVLIGEVGACAILGLFLLKVLEPHRNTLFPR